MVGSFRFLKLLIWRLILYRFLVNPRLCVFESQMSYYLALMRNATPGDIVERDSWILDKQGIVFEHV